MRKLVALVITCAVLFQNAHAAVIYSEKINANDVIIPIGNSGKTISLKELSTISQDDFEKIIGKHMNFSDKAMFRTAQRKIRHNLSADGTVNSKKLEKYFNKHGKFYSEDSSFNLGGFALGLLLGLIGVLIAYIINNDNNHSRRLWAWIGWGVFVIVYLAILL